MIFWRILVVLALISVLILISQLICPFNRPKAYSGGGFVRTVRRTINCPHPFAPYKFMIRTVFSAILFFYIKMECICLSFYKNLCNHKIMNQFNAYRLGCEEGAEWGAKGCAQFKNDVEKKHLRASRASEVQPIKNKSAPDSGLISCSKTAIVSWISN